MEKNYNKFIVQIYDETSNIPGLGDGPFIDPPILISEEHFRTLKSLGYNIIKIGELLIVGEVKDNINIDNYSINRIELSRELQQELDSYKNDISKLKNAISKFKINLPKISDRRTWLLYNYDLNCYIDSGIKCDNSEVQPVGIKKLEINNEHHLIVTLTNDIVQDAGTFPINLPIKGIDYWTKYDKQEINDYVVNNLDLSSYNFVSSENLENTLNNYITNNEFEEYKNNTLDPIFNKVLDDEENLQNLNEKVNNLENNVNDLQIYSVNLDDRINSINTNNNEINNKINNNENEINNIKSDINNIRDSVNENYERIQEFSNNIEDINNNIENVNNNIDDVNNNISNLNDITNNQSNDISNMQDQISENTNNIKLNSEKLKKIGNISESYIDEKVKINSISVNDNKLYIDENKNVNINIPKKLSDLIDDSSFITKEDLNLEDSRHIHKNINILNNIEQENVDFWNNKMNLSIDNNSETLIFDVN